MSERMDWKNFFKPGLFKVLVFLVFAAVNYFLIKKTFALFGMILVGWPLEFYPVGRIYCLGIWGCMEGMSLSWANFFINLIIWYLLACVFVFLGREIKVRRNQS
ncbi:MAG: hypothetical protein ABIE23_06540 [archaeon]